ncbi:MAG: hypothetical protein ACREFH_12455, partial [Stellaceae bacterium]
EVGVNTAVAFDTSGSIRREDHADTTSGGPANARVQLGDGTNAFNQPAFAQAFSAFRNDQATFWVDLNADNTVPDNRGIGAAGVDLTYTAVKEPGDAAFTLHATGGKLALADPDAGSVPLSALVEFDAFVLHGQDVLKHVSARAELFGNGRSLTTPVIGPGAFALRSHGFDIQPRDFFIDTDLDDTNEIGAELDLRPLNIPVDLSNIVDGTPITIEVTLNGEVRAPGAETIASAFFRDPTDLDDADPFSGAATITFETATTPPPPAGIPEPPAAAMLGMALLAPALFALRFRRRRIAVS